MSGGRIGSIPKKSVRGISHSLTLLNSENKIYGIFIRNYQKGNSGDWYYDCKKSFAFNCGANSSHLLAAHTSEDIKLEFKTCRKLTESEEKIGGDESESYKWWLKLFPLSIRGTNKTAKNSDTVYKVKFWVRNDDKYRRISRNEIWSIPCITTYCNIFKFLIFISISVYNTLSLHYSTVCFGFGNDFQVEKVIFRKLINKNKPNIKLILFRSQKQ